MFGQSSQEFRGFDAQDFDAFEERKWSNNRFNLERMRVRGKVEALQRVYEHAFERAGVPIQSEVSLDHPTILNNKKVDAIWLTFWRTDEQRRELARLIEREIPLAERVSDPDPHHQHLVMGVKIHVGGVDVCLRLHRHAVLDARNLFEKAGDTWEGENLRLILEAIPEGFELRVPDQPSRPVTDLRKGLAELRANLGAGAGEVALGRTFPRSEPVLADAACADLILDALNRLLPVYRYAVWDRENDFLSIKKILKEERLAHRAGSVPAKAAAPSAPQAGAARPGGTKAGAPKAAGPLKKGDRVCVTAGLFSGKEGQVTEIDPRGRIKVVLGKLAVTLTEREIKRA